MRGAVPRWHSPSRWYYPMDIDYFTRAFTMVLPTLTIYVPGATLIVALFSTLPLNTVLPSALVMITSMPSAFVRPINLLPLATMIFLPLMVLMPVVTSTTTAFEALDSPLS